MQHFATSSGTIKSEKKSLASKPRLLSLYYDPPQIELTLDEFEMFSLDRLQLLRGIETLKAKGDDNSFNAKVNELERKYITNKKDGYSRLDDVERDQISHFILRLAYCRTEDLRRWFLIQECALLKYRLDYLSDSEREQFMNSNNLFFEVVEEAEKQRKRDKLMHLAGVTDETTFVRTTFYKIPFVQALSLIGGRQVYLEDGHAYVPLQRVVSIIVTRYRMHLSRALVEASNNFDYVGSDTRIGPLLKNMNKQFIGNDFSTKSQSLDKLSPEKVDMAAEVNMPLCMKNLHNNLKKEHKLKHWGRLQYGLFLKGAGLDMDGAQQFWEQQFTKIMTHDQYMKSYSYNIRHMYGKEGARKNYTPYSCMKIIMGAAPEAGGHHGCPYRHMPDSQLGLLLNNLKIGSDATKEIVNLAKTSNYQLACQKHFDVTHPNFQALDLKMGDNFASHPNLWFQASVSYHRAKNGAPTTSSNSTSVAVAATDDVQQVSGTENISSSSEMIVEE